MKISRLEKESIIIYNEAEPNATVETCNAALMKRLDGFAAKSTAITVVSENEHGKRYQMPKEWIKVQFPRQLSDEQRQKLREQAWVQFKLDKNKEEI